MPTLRGGPFASILIPQAHCAEYEAAELEAGRARLIPTILLGTIIYVLFLPVSWWTLPDVRLMDTLGRLLLGIPHALLVCTYVRRARTVLAQQLAAGTLALALMIWISWIFSVSTSPLSPIILTAACILIIYVILILRLRTTLGVILSTLAGLSQLLMSALVGGHSIQVVVICLSVNASIVLSGAYVLNELHNERRRSYLLSVRDRIRLEQLNQRNAHLDALSETDVLTGLSNRRRLDRYLSETERCPAGGVIECLLLDVDHFKPFNDTYGHVAGDKALRAIGGSLRRVCRDAEVVCRYGGEEFAVVRHRRPGSDAQDGLARAETVRRAVAALEIPHAPNPPSGKITVSVGLATAAPRELLSDTLQHADEALYAAKGAGRDRVSEYTPPPTAAPRFALVRSV